MFRTKIPHNKADLKVNHTNNLLLVGSCFTQNIGNKLAEHKFNTASNPFGILYNPISIFGCLNAVSLQQKYTESNLVFNNERYHSLQHHSVFSNSNKNDCLQQINQATTSGYNNLQKADFCFISLGSAWVHVYNKTNTAVGNCHKISNTEFTKKLLTVKQITDAFEETLENLQRVNPTLQFIFTVSPVRHIKDGFHENQLSKSTLLLAINELQNKYKQVHYFPSYEIMMDDLRDYRFYEDDMLHPSKKAIEYIWNYFTESYFTTETKDLCAEISKINDALNHKPFNQNSEAHKAFLNTLNKRIKNIQTKLPSISFN